VLLQRTKRLEVVLDAAEPQHHIQLHISRRCAAHLVTRVNWQPCKSPYTNSSEFCCQRFCCQHTVMLQLKTSCTAASHTCGSGRASVQNSSRRHSVVTNPQQAAGIQRSAGNTSCIHCYVLCQHNCAAMTSSTGWPGTAAAPLLRLAVIVVTW
jgi:hypothetical protein